MTKAEICDISLLGLKCFEKMDIANIRLELFTVVLFPLIDLYGFGPKCVFTLALFT